MSLIQEALKRQQAEYDKTGATPRAEVSPRGATPPPLPSKPKKKAKSKGWLVLLGSALVLLLLAGAAMTFFMKAAQPYLPPIGEPSALPSQEKTPGVASNLLIKPLQKAVAAAKAAQSAHQMEPEAQPEEGPVPVKVSVPVEAKAKPVSVTEAAETKKRPSLVLGIGSGGSPAPTASARAESAPTAPLAWPKLLLNGVMHRASMQASAALINRTMVGVDETIDGVRLIEVRSSSVVLEYQNERRTLYVGQSTL